MQYLCADGYELNVEQEKKYTDWKYIYGSESTDCFCKKRRDSIL